jgi:hypothetical protein
VDVSLRHEKILQQKPEHLSFPAKSRKGTRNERFERVQTRLQRVEHFIDYLQEEEKREREFYSLGMPEEEMFTYASKKAFVTERSRVLASAVKTKGRQKHGGRRGRR